MLPTPVLGMHPRLPMAHHQVRFPVHPSAGHPRFHAVQRFQRFDYPPPAVVPQTYISPISSPTCLPSGLVSPAHSSPTVLSEGYVSPAASPTDALQEVPEESTSPSCSSSGSPALPLDTHAASSPALPLDMQAVRSPVPPLNMHAIRSNIPLNMHAGSNATQPQFF